MTEFADRYSDQNAKRLEQMGTQALPTRLVEPHVTVNHEGHEAIVIVHPGRVLQQPVVAHIWPVSSFEAEEQVKFWRKATAVWNTTNLEERRAALLAGCRDSLPEFQDYCCRRLANWRGGKPDQNAAEQLERLAALPVIWKRFVDPDTPLEVVASCDEILG